MFKFVYSKMSVTRIKPLKRGNKMGVVNEGFIWSIPPVLKFLDFIKFEYYF